MVLLQVPIFVYLEGEDLKYFFAPLIVISEPHGVSPSPGLNGGCSVNTYITAPSNKSFSTLPVNVNLWYEPKFYGSGNQTLVYNPYAIVDEKGEAIIQNDSPSYEVGGHEHDLHDSLILCYVQSSSTEGDGDSEYRYGSYEIYRDSEITGEGAKKIAEELNHLKLDLDLASFQYRALVQKPSLAVDSNGYNSTYYLMHAPIYISNVDLMETAVGSGMARSIGDFKSCAYFNGRLCFASGNVIKLTNEFLEWDGSNTLVVGGTIRKLISLHSMLYIFTDDGIYTMNQENKISKFSSIKATHGAVYGDRLLFASEDGRIYHTEFSPIPAAQQWQLTETPYIIKEEDTEIIRNISETWTIYDVASLDDRVYIATNKGVWVYHGPTKSWWEQRYPYEVLRLVRWTDKIIGVGGRYLDLILVDISKFKDIPLFNPGPA